MFIFYKGQLVLLYILANSDVLSLIRYHTLLVGLQLREKWRPWSFGVCCCVPSFARHELYRYRVQHTAQYSGFHDSTRRRNTIEKCEKFVRPFPDNTLGHFYIWNRWRREGRRNWLVFVPFHALFGISSPMVSCSLLN